MQQSGVDGWWSRLLMPLLSRPTLLMQRICTQAKFSTTIHELNQNVQFKVHK